MTNDVLKFPREKVYPPIVRGKEMWEQDEPPDEMVWAVCPHLRIVSPVEDSRCHRCPKWEDDEDYGKCQRMCYGLAAEVCKIVFAMQKRGV